MTDEPELVAALDAAAEEADDFWVIGDAIHKRVGDDEEKGKALRGVIWAFRFDYLAVEQEASRQAEGSPWGPAMQFGDARMPPPLRDIDDAFVEQWARLVAQARTAGVRARLHDLLWERKQGERPHEHALAAVDAYCEISEDPSWNWMARTHALERASELARQLSNTEQQDRVVAHMERLAREELAETSDDRPGVTLNLIEAILRLPADRHPATLPELIDAADDAYGSDPFLADTVSDLRAAIAEPGEQTELRRQQVGRWLDRAEQESGLRKHHAFQRAYQLAKRNGQEDLAQQARVALQSMTDEDLELKTLSAEVKVPTEKIEQIITSLLGDGWQDCLTRVGAQRAPGGTPEDLEAEVREQMARAPIQNLVTRQVTAEPYGQLIYQAVSWDQHERVNQAQQRAMAAQLQGFFYTEAFGRIPGQYGRPSREELTEFFTTDLISREIAERIARAFELYWDGEYDDSAHVLVPRLEGILRDLAHRVGIPVIALPEGERLGRVLPAGDVLRQLRDVFPDPGAHAYFTNLLTDPLGLNLRNNIGHGIAGTVQRSEAALLLQAACQLRLFRVSAA